MRRFGKFLLFVVSLYGAVCTAAMLVITAFENSIAAQYLIKIVSAMGSTTTYYAVLAYLILATLAFVALLATSIALPGKVMDMQFRRAKGNLLFTRQSLESAIRLSFAHLDGITDARVRVKVKHPAEKSRVSVRLSVTDGRHFVGLSEEVQALIEGMLLESLGVTVRDIQIKIVQLQGNASTQPTIPVVEPSGEDEA